MLEKILPNNEHTIDRAVRILLGLSLIALALVGPHAWWGWLGAVPLLTGLIGSCPAYTLMGVSTCKHQSRATS